MYQGNFSPKALKISLQIYVQSTAESGEGGQGGMSGPCPLFLCH